MVLGQVDGAVVQNSSAISNGVVAGKGNVGIWTWQSNDVTIQHNTAMDNRSPMGGDGGGFDLDGGVTNSKIQYNVSQDNSGAGYLLAEFSFAEPMRQNVFRYNVSLNDGGDSYGSITIAGEDSASAAASSVFHNNTVVVDRNVVPANRGAVWFLNGAHDEISLINNLFVALNGAALVAGQTAPDKANFVNNDYWSAGTPLVIEGVTYASVAQWAAATGQEFADGQYLGRQIDPHFGPIGGFTPRPPSGVIDAGLSAGSDAWPAWLVDLGSSDLVGTPVPQSSTADIGAIEAVLQPGDFNRDGTVDSADYVIWRSELGNSGDSLWADADQDGTVDADDLGIWRTHFGNSYPAGSGSHAIPEPSSIFIAVALAILIARARIRYLLRA
jgi:hypothetical protein